MNNFWYEHLHLEISWILYVVVWEHWFQSYDGRVELRSILVTNRDLLKCECFERSSTISWKTRVCLAWKLKSTWTVYIYVYFCATTKCQMFYIKATFYLYFFCRPNRISWKKCAFCSTLSRLSAREIRCWKILVGLGAWLTEALWKSNISCLSQKEKSLTPKLTKWRPFKPQV